MKTIFISICIPFIALLFCGCSTLTDSDGRIVMQAKGFARDSGYNEFINVKYADPVTVTNPAGWIAKSGIPLERVTEINASRNFESKSNVGSTAAGMAKMVNAAADLMPK